MRFNRTRIYLMGGNPELALQSLPEFSELTPLNAAGEVLTLAAIHRDLGRDEQATHWCGTANRMIEAHGLSKALARQPNGVWSVPMPFASV